MTEDELNAYDAETVRLTTAAEQRIAQAEAEAASAAGVAKARKKFAQSEAKELRKLIRERADGRGKDPAPTLLDMVKPAAGGGSTWRDTPIKEMPIADGIKAFLSFEPCKTAGDLADEFAATTELPFGLAPGDVADVKAALAEMSAPRADCNAVLADLWRHYPVARWTRFGLTAKDVERLEAGEVKRESAARPIRTVGDLSDFSRPTASGYSRGYADVKGIGAAGADRISEAETRFWGWWNDGGQDEYAAERGLKRAAIARSAGGPDEAGTGGADSDREPSGGATPAHESGEEIAF
jgi:hypothetical protein